MSRARYFVDPGLHEVLAWAELREHGGKYRIEVGTFRTVAEARAACERDAERRCRREGEPLPGRLDIRVARGR
jgi:hypothetical protein